MLRGRLTGMRAWTVVGIGQALSLIGTGMSQFGLSIWAYEQTGQATTLTLAGFFYITPLLLLSPLAGTLVDRYDRKLLAMVSDLAAGLVSISLFALLKIGWLEVWHLYLGFVVLGTFASFQAPAISAAMATTLPKDQLVRANAILELGANSAHVLGPLAAGALIGLIGLPGLLLIDILSFSFAVGALLLMVVPPMPRREESQGGPGAIWREMIYGFEYVAARPSLLWLQSMTMIGNFFHSAAYALLTPYLLSRTGGDELALGSVRSIASLGAIAGAALLTAWGGPKRRIHGALLGWAVSLLPLTLLGIGRPGLALPALVIWSVAAFLGQTSGPWIMSSNQAIWQSKVAPDLQGRTRAIRRAVAFLAIPLANLAAGPLADRVMEPAMQVEGPLAPAFGWLVGVGPGAGMGLLMLAFGVLGALIALGGYLIPVLRDVETILPDWAGPEAQGTGAPAPAAGEDSAVAAAD